MIYDLINNSDLYLAINPNLEKAFDFLRKKDLFALEIGKHEIDGENSFALVSEYKSKDLLNGRWEAHKNYLDIQLILKGKEKFGFSNLKEMTAVTAEYSVENDIMFFEGRGNFLELTAGYFVMVFPGDSHMPGIDADEKTDVRKIVVKVKI
ncbi:MAG: YhcH/YjgK/YiaL family protein [Melioribacteraceae bacterium]|nr:YhcH/YjgK/YiaL family protein [Melioribacteraceae bacterium]